MNLLVLGVGGLLAATGAWALVFPGQALRLLRWFQSTGIYSPAIAIRLAFGVALLLGAQATRWPALAIALGVMFLLGAAAIPLLGEERISAIIGWWLDHPPGWLQARSIRRAYPFTWHHGLTPPPDWIMP